MSATETDTPPKLAFPAPFGTEGKKDDAPPKLDGQDTPPKRRGRPPGSGNASKMSIKTIEDGLNQQFTILGTVVSVANQYDGRCILEGTPKLSAAIAQLCERNPKVRKNIERMLAGGMYGEVVIAAALIAVPIMANHDLLPPQIKAMYGQAIPEDEPERAEV